jgi:hypothetical protein
MQGPVALSPRPLREVGRRVVPFAEPADAERFMTRFGGEMFDPKQRGKGVYWARIGRAGTGYGDQARDAEQNGPRCCLQ